MRTKKKIFILILSIEALAIAGLVVVLLYLNSDTVKVNHQLELAQHYLLEEDYEQAIAAYEIAIEIDPKNAEAYLGLAEAYVAADDLENAVKTLKKASQKTDSEEVLAMLEVHTTEMEQRGLVAQASADATTAAPKETAAISQPEATHRGFIMQGDDWYYYDETGNLVTGWFETNGSRYCARNDGTLYRNGEHEIDSTKYQFDQLGVCLGEVGTEKKLLIREEGYNGDGTLRGYYVNSYDSQGNRTREEYYDGDGTLEWYDVYSYDSQGNMTRLESYGSDGTLDYYNINSYDSQGNMTRIENYGSDGTPDWYNVNSYDSQGNMTRVEWYGSDGTLAWYNVNSYDSQGNMTREENYDSDGTLKGYNVNSYDSQGNMAKEENYDSDGTLAWYNVYSYDSQGNMTRSEGYNSDGTIGWYYVYSYGS